MIQISLVALIILSLSAGMVSVASEASDKQKEPTSIYDFVMPLIDSSSVSLKDYQGKVILIVNVASKCGFTGQYEGLQKLYENYKDKGFVILGFPANNFLGQEPGTEKEIAEFCKLNYGVTFPMFSKISVKGKDQHPLYKFLTESKANPEHAGKISWNFNKFIIDRKGNIVARFGSMTSPLSKKLVAEVEQALSNQLN
jgi:glutathione peroxidase